MTIKPHLWDPKKNLWLRRNRGFGFEDIVEAVENGGLLDDMKHPGQLYSHQRLYIVDLNGYAVVVPYVEDPESIFLKNGFPRPQGQ